MSRDTEINIKLTPKAKDIYDTLPRPKNRYVSDAIIEKHERNNGTDLAAQVQELRERVERIERKEEEG